MYFLAKSFSSLHEFHVIVCRLNSVVAGLMLLTLYYFEVNPYHMSLSICVGGCLGEP